DAELDEFADRVVEREPVGHVAPGAVDIQPDLAPALVGQLAKAFDDGPRAVLVDVADQVDVAQALGLLPAEDVLDGGDQIVQEALVELAHHAARFRTARADQSSSADVSAGVSAGAPGA